MAPVSVCLSRPSCPKLNLPSVFPLIFHSIKDEIPDASRPLITRLYQLWLLLFATLIINMVACIFILLAGVEDGARDLGASIGYLLLSTFISRSHILVQLSLPYFHPLFPPLVSVGSRLPLHDFKTNLRIKSYIQRLHEGKSSIPYFIPNCAYSKPTLGTISILL